MGTYLVRVGGCQAGTRTTAGVVESVVRDGIDYYVVTFEDGSTLRKRYNQTLNVIE